jgi:hypothetical protein
MTSACRAQRQVFARQFASATVDAVEVGRWVQLHALAVFIMLGESDGGIKGSVAGNGGLGTNQGDGLLSCRATSRGIFNCIVSRAPDISIYTEIKEMSMISKTKRHVRIDSH